MSLGRRCLFEDANQRAGDSPLEPMGTVLVLTLESVRSGDHLTKLKSRTPHRGLASSVAGFYRAPKSGAQPLIFTMLQLPRLRYHERMQPLDLHLDLHSADADEVMQTALRNKSPAQRLAIAHGMWRHARRLVMRVLQMEHPDWSLEQLRQEAARRLSHGAV